MDLLVFLDFDGVICDSATEGLVSSWKAYFEYVRGEVPAAVPVGLWHGFLTLRPYVRSGEDFIICQEILYQGLAVHCQSDFDLIAAGKSAASLARLRDLFYQARAALLQQDKQYWIGLNRLYGPVAEHLHRWGDSPEFHILSTKRSEFIVEILAAAGIPFPRERILYSEKDEKGTRISEALERRGAQSAMLVDDQIDHLLAIRGAYSQIVVYLAAWGYVKPEWLVGSSIPVLRLEDLGSVVDAALYPRP